MKDILQSLEWSSKTVFLAALAVRWGLTLAVFLLMGGDGLLGADSRSFLQWILEHANRIRAGDIHGWLWMGPNPTLLPVPSLLWTANALAFGSHAALTSVLCAGLLDSGTCVFAYRMAKAIDPALAGPAGLLSVLNPTQIVMAGLFYTDTIFVFFVAATLFGAIGWLHAQAWRHALLMGIGMGGAILSRAVIAPWAVALVLCLVVAAAWRRDTRGQQLARLSLSIAIAVTCATPLIARNHAETGEWTLTTQTGAHAAYWVVPLVMQAKSGTPWEQGAALMHKRFDERYAATNTNNGETSRQLTAMAREALADLGPLAIAKAWIIGAGINLGAPVATIFPPLAQMPRTGFFATPGGGMSEKIVNFLFHSDNRLFAWATLTGIAGVLVFRLVQLKGLLTLLANRTMRKPAILLGSWVAFILLVSGPIASPKYRLPIEPALIVFAAAGLRRRGPNARAAIQSSLFV